ncbi:MAG TPA: ABC transporter ATP-binding protein [Thermoleophilaceae bacterium]|nr:ABC transporter ATP-binding protein [Thermoleophilaceae bacterium]
MLEISGLNAGYGRVEVLQGVDLEVGEDEIVALVGSNGAGKTTLLRAVSGVIAAAAGSVRFKGDEIGGLPPEEIVDRGVAHVPEGRRLFAGLTVRENLMVGGYSGHTEDIESAVALFPLLGERLGQAAGSLSGGEQQMCAIARGLMSSPALIMIDELSLGLAPKLVDEIVERLRTVAEDGTAVLLVDQDVDAALRLAARGYVLETGRIVVSGPSAELLEDERVREAYLSVA